MQKQNYYLSLFATSLFISYLAVATPLPVVSIYTFQTLELTSTLAGFAVGICFFATIITRSLAGKMSDTQGTMRAVHRGLCCYALAGFLCFLATLVEYYPLWAYTILIVGRLLLGFGESLTLVGMLAWGIGFVGTANSGKLLSIAGMSIYGAFAVGGPLGLWLYNKLNFSGLMLICAILPIIGLLLFRLLPIIVPLPPNKKCESFLRVIKQIWPYGFVLCLQGVGFAAIGAFISLIYMENHWHYPGFALTAFGLGFVLVRIICGHLPDRLGGIAITITSLIVESIGQLLLWQATEQSIAIIGALLTGIGCSMIFPAMGAEVIKKITPNQRGIAMAGFAAFQDLSYALTAPVIGLFVDLYGFSIVFFIGLLAALFALVMVLFIWRCRLNKESI
ncbi:MFS transporter [Orbus sturtevantii]|uniref:MFS transporter n=1 Tax=Orbus sturtevantii TaxID=3074109 RepID=UPI00370D6434